MKEQKINYAKIIVNELWSPSIKLRFVKRKVVDFNSQLVDGIHLEKEVNILQQLHTSNLRNYKWIDVPTELEN